MPRPYKTDVIVASATRDLTTLDTVKAELGITTNANDDFLSNKIHQASAAIASACNRYFQQETLADFFSLDWATCRSTAPLVLSRIPVTSIDSVIEGTSAITDYQYDTESGLVWRMMGDVRRYWFGGQVKVTYVGGYELLATLPYDLEQACVMLVRGHWFQRSRDPLVKSVNIPGVAAYVYNLGDVGSVGQSALPPDVESLIAPYRRPQAV